MKILLYLTFFAVIFNVSAVTQISIDTSFEGANSRVISINNTDNLVKIESKLRSGDVHNVVFYCRISGFNVNAPLKIQVKYSQQYYLPVLAAYSYDKITWFRFTGTIVGDSKEFTRIYSQSSVYFCYGYPYVYSDMINLAQYVEQSAYGNVSNIAVSNGGRQVKLFSITEPCVNDSDKYSIWMIGRNHAMETHSNYVVEGFVKFLLSEDPIADHLRRLAVVYVVPIMDVDMAAIGGTGKDQLPVDFNRDWDSPSYWQAITAVKTKILETNALNPLKIWIDSHDPFPGSPGNSERLFFYSRYSSGPKSVNLDFFRKLLFENGSYVFDRQPMYATSGQTSTSWVDSMIASVELPLSLETGWVNRTDNVQWTIPLYNFNGEVLAKGMCDYLNNIIRSGDIILDNNDTLTGVQITGQWITSTFVPGYWGSNYIHDNNTGKGLKSVKYSPNIPQDGVYEVFVRWTQDSGRAANVPVRIFYSGIIKDTVINQKTRGSEWVSMGYYELVSGNQNYVLIKNDNTNQFVIADAVRFSLRDNCDPISINSNEIEIPGNHILYQNYPNPFNPVTNIKVHIAVSGSIKLIIYDANGKEVKTIINKYLLPGLKNFQWDAGNNSSGVYFYSLMVNDKVMDTKKMLLIK